MPILPPINPPPVTDPAATERANHDHLVWDVGWFGLGLPAMVNFLAVFAIHLGASPFELGLLASIPAVVTLFAAMGADWWRSRYTDTIRALMSPSLGMRLRVPLFALVPFLPEAWRVPALIALVGIAAVPSSISSIIFLVMLRETISDGGLTQVVAHRQLAMNIGVGLGTIGFGLWLERAPFPLNYQVMFITAFAALLVSQWHVHQLRTLFPTAAPPPARGSLLARMRATAAVWQVPDFRRVSVVVTALFVAFQALAPIIPLHLVQELGASEGFVAVFGFLELLGAAGASAVAHRLLLRLKHRRALTLGIGGTGFAALLLAAAPSLPFTLPAALISGACWTLTDISQFSFFSLHANAENRRIRTRAYYQTVSIGLFIGPLLGSTLADTGMSLITVLLLGAALRFGVGVLVQRQTGERLQPQPTTPAPAA